MYESRTKNASRARRRRASTRLRPRQKSLLRDRRATERRVNGRQDFFLRLSPRGPFHAVSTEIENRNGGCRDHRPRDEDDDQFDRNRTPIGSVDARATNVVRARFTERSSASSTRIAAKNSDGCGGLIGVCRWTFAHAHARVRLRNEKGAPMARLSRPALRRQVSARRSRSTRRMHPGRAGLPAPRRGCPA